MDNIKFESRAQAEKFIYCYITSDYIIIKEATIRLEKAGFIEQADKKVKKVING